jgi:hypothetical protein
MFWTWNCVLKYWCILLIVFYRTLDYCTEIRLKPQVQMLELLMKWIFFLKKSVLKTRQEFRVFYMCVSHGASNKSYFSYGRTYHMKKCRCNQLITDLAQILVMQSDYVRCITKETCAYGSSAYVAYSFNVDFIMSSVDDIKKNC